MSFPLHASRATTISGGLASGHHLAAPARRMRNPQPTPLLTAREFWYATGALTSAHARRPVVLVTRLSPRLAQQSFRSHGGAGDTFRWC